MFVDVLFLGCENIKDAPLITGYFAPEVQINNAAFDSIYLSRSCVDKLYITDEEVNLDNLDDLRNWSETVSRIDPTYDSVTPLDWDGYIFDIWNWGTKLNANFNGNLLGGSINFAAESTVELRLKRRKVGEAVWKTIYVQPINGDPDNFKFEYLDKTAAGNTEYEYILIPLLTEYMTTIDGEKLYAGEQEGAINDYMIIKEKSDFHDFFILDKDISYGVIINSKNSFQYNQEGSSQTTIARKYPYIIKNGNVGYYSGTLEGTFVRFNDKECTWEFDRGAFYRQEVDKFLSNGNVKIIKDWMGNIFMANVFDVIQQENDDYVYTPIHSVAWTECGDANMIADLYDNGFIDTDIDREW